MFVWPLDALPHHSSIYGSRHTMWILLMFALFAAKPEACGEYGDGMEAAECTQGFPTMFHIDQVLRNTELDTVASRQVLVPSINFTCNGTITKWIFGANWRGFSPALTEFQIWRSVSSTTYRKMSGTEVRVGGRNSSDMYEYQLQTPLEFQTGDILGYFQPIANRNQLDLYLEDSNRITTYHQSLCVDCLSPSPTVDTFSLTSAPPDTRYPVIAVTTDPPDCGCGFMSVKRVHSLLSSSDRHDRDYLPRRAIILFPNLNFTCMVHILKWTVAARYRSPLRDAPAEVNLWRMSGNSSTLYKRVNNSVSEVSVLSRRRINNVEFTPIYPVVAQPGDIVGITGLGYRFLSLYDSNWDTVFYWSEESQDEFDVSDSRIEYGRPMITVEVAPVRPTSSHSISIHLKQATEDPKITQSPSLEIKQSTNIGTNRIPIMVGSAVSVFVVTVISVIVLITSCVCWRRRCLANKARALPVGTNIETENDYEKYVQKDNMYAYAAQPTLCSATEQNVAYNAHSFDNHADTPSIGKHISSNDASGGSEYEESYDNVVSVKGEHDVLVTPNSAYATTLHQSGYYEEDLYVNV